VRRYLALRSEGVTNRSRDTIGDLARIAAEVGISVGQEPPPDADVIEVYPQKRAGQPDTSAGPMAVMFQQGDRMHLAVPDTASFESQGVAWRYFIRQLGWYFDRGSSAETLWAYACYHCGTMANFHGGTAWIHRIES